MQNSNFGSDGFWNLIVILIILGLLFLVAAAAYLVYTIIHLL
ncbi:MAG TPA: hypothetical protein VEB42_06195 [Chitinophagaceae bacterium]|nr:hypothetical protein [Chitinophagaceae bacterium]